MIEVGKNQVGDFTKQLRLRLAEVEFIRIEVAFANEETDVVKGEAFEDLAEGVEQGDGTAGRGLHLTIARLHD